MNIDGNVLVAEAQRQAAVTAPTLVVRGDSDGVVLFGCIDLNRCNPWQWVATAV